jgi:hypothetical protein
MAAKDDKKNLPPIDLTQGIDFSDVSTEFEPLAKGDYPAVIEDSEVRTGQQSGQPYLNVTFDLKDSPGKQWGMFSLTPQSLWRLKQLAVRAGVSAEFLASAPTIDMIRAELKNRDVVLRLDIEEYYPNDAPDKTDPQYKKKRNKIVEVLAPGSGNTNGAGGKKRSF